MKRYIAVDSGKYATKVVEYDVATDTIKTQKFRTKISEGNFKDDALERSTLIVEYNGNVLKIGNGAVQEAELNTSKATEIHRNCILTAIAMNASDNEVDEVCVAVGIPVKEWENVEKRSAFKEYILPDDKEIVEMKIKMSSDSDPVTKRFRVVAKHVYPESQGALFLDEIIARNSGTVGIIDIGNLNINCTSWTMRELDREYSLTDELGGNILISGLSQELSAAFSRVDGTYVAKVLKQDYENRKLVPNRPNPEIEEQSKAMIDEYLLNHVKMIKRRCDSKHWSLDFMNLVFIGGTSELLEREIRQVFGEDVFIPENPEYANVLGFLRIMCAKHLKKNISLTSNEHNGNTNAASKTGK